VFPSLVSVLGIMIWNDVVEIKTDVKALIAQSNVDKTRIDNLEREVYKTNVTYKLPSLPLESKKVLKYDMIAVINKNDLTPKEYETHN
jgi:hypothetical protein